MRYRCWSQSILTRQNLICDQSWKNIFSLTFLSHWLVFVTMNFCLIRTYCHETLPHKGSSNKCETLHNRVVKKCKNISLSSKVVVVVEQLNNFDLVDRLCNKTFKRTVHEYNTRDLLLLRHCKNKGIEERVPFWHCVKAGRIRKNYPRPLRNSQTYLIIILPPFFQIGNRRGGTHAPDLLISCHL